VQPSEVQHIPQARSAASSGRALFITMSAIFFTESVGLSAAKVGLGLTIAAAVALLVGVPAGRLADRVGPRTVAVTLLVGVPAGRLADRVGPRTVAVTLLAARLAGTLSYLMVSEFFGFLAVATVLAVLEAAGSAAGGALIPAPSRPRTVSAQGFCCGR
jgi:nitrate/nitrite transporter NarK